MWDLILELAKTTKLSDIHIHADAPLAYREFGDMIKVERIIEAEEIREFLQEVLPEVVTLAPYDSLVTDDGQIISASGSNYLSVSYESLVPLLVQGIKDLKKQLSEYKINNSYKNNLNQIPLFNVPDEFNGSGLGLKLKMSSPGKTSASNSVTPLL